MHKRVLLATAAMLIGAWMGVTALGQLFSDDFDVDSSNDWTVNEPGVTDFYADIFFDFTCMANTTDVTLNDEAEDFEWVSVEEALTLPIDSYTETAIREYLKRTDL